MKKDTKEFKAIHIRAMKVLYGKQYEQWRDIMAFDDRRGFCVLYDKIIEAFESLPDELDNYVIVALIDKFRKDEQTMKEICEVFKGR